MATFRPGQRVRVNDPALAELAAIFEKATGEKPPSNNEGVVSPDRWDSDDTVLIHFDDGGAAPYPVEMVEAL